MTNKVVLIGNLTREPEIKTMTNGTTVAQFSIAVQRQYLNAEGERDVDFFSIVAWRGLADSVAKYVKKGHKVCIVGSLQTKTYTDKNGTKRTQWEVLAQDIEFLGGNQSNNFNNNEVAETTQTSTVKTYNNISGKNQTQAETTAKKPARTSSFVPPQDPKPKSLSDLYSFADTDDEDLPF